MSQDSPTSTAQEAIPIPILIAASIGACCFITCITVFWCTFICVVLCRMRKRSTREERIYVDGEDSEPLITINRPHNNNDDDDDDDDDVPPLDLTQDTPEQSMPFAAPKQNKPTSFFDRFSKM